MRALSLLVLGGCAAVPTFTAPSSSSSPGGPPSEYRDVAEQRAWEGAYTMPAVDGVTPAEAWRRLRAAGHVGVIDFHAPVHRDAFDGGRVGIVDAPAAGEERTATIAVSLAVDAPPTRLAVVPALAGLDAPDALDALNASGIFDVSISLSGECGADRVCGQDEEAGEVINADAGVSIELGARGNPARGAAARPPAIDAPSMRELAMPDVAGLSPVQVWRALAARRHAGSLQLRAHYRDDARAVVLLADDTGRAVRADELIMVRVDAPRRRDVRLPDLIGRSAADALAALTAAGVLDISLDRAPNLGLGCEADVVCSQDPAPGAEGDHIQLVLGAGR